MDVGILAPKTTGTKMSIFRVNKTSNYTVMSNCHLKDKRLSLKAKGLLSQMLSLPDDWDFTIAGLVVINQENESAIKSALKELRSTGYLVMTKRMPGQTKSGRIEYIYDIYENPKQQQESQNQGVEVLPVEVQPVENQGQLNTNNKDTDYKVLNKYSLVEKSRPEIPYGEIVDYLNEVVGTSYRPTTGKTKELIRARFKEGFTLEDFKTVIDNKAADWLNDKERKKYLRPETLFGTKFEGYLNQPRRKMTTKDLASKMDFSDFTKF